LVLTLMHPLDAALRTARRTIGDGLTSCMGGLIEGWRGYSLLTIRCLCLLKKYKFARRNSRLCLFCKYREEKIDLEASRYWFYRKVGQCPSPVLLMPRMT